MPKIYAIEGGGDWADASVEFVVFDGEAYGMFEALVAAWKDYMRARDDAMRANAVDNGDRKIPGYIPLTKWLLKNGAREPTDDELEVYYEV